MRIRNPFRAVALTLLVSLLTALPVTAKKPKCFPREGHCVLVTVNGQTAEKISKKSRKQLRPLEKVSYYVDDTEYEIPEPIRGELVVGAQPVPGSESFLGSPRDFDVTVLPLQEVEIDTRKGRTVDDTVQMGGSAAVGEADFIKDNRLPPGLYLLQVKLRGTKNWDRQTTLVRVVE